MAAEEIHILVTIIYNYSKNNSKMESPMIGMASMIFSVLLLSGCKNQYLDSPDSDQAVAKDDIGSMINVAICCDLLSPKNPCASFVKSWNLDRGASFLEKNDLTYEEALSYAAFIDVNVRTEGIAAWAVSLGELPPDDGSSGEYPQGHRLERLIHLRELAYKKLGIIQLNEYFTSWEKLDPLFSTDPNSAFAREKSIEGDYRVASCKILHALYAKSP